MAIREDIINFLRSPEVVSIDVWFPSLNLQIRDVRVNGSSFERVARAIETNRIHISTDTAELVGGSSAQYVTENRGISARTHRPVGNTMFIPAFTTIHDRAGVVHESVHASFDVTHSVLPQLDNETAAFVALGIYYLKAGYVGGFGDAPHSKALEVAREYQRTQSINPVKLNELRAAISLHPVYSSWIGGTYRGDGVS